MSTPTPPVQPSHVVRALQRFDAVRRARVLRHMRWRSFRTKAASQLIELADNREDIAYFQPYGYRVIQGGLLGYDQRAVELRFGSYAVDFQHGQPQANGFTPFRTDVDEGGALRYQRTLTGHVLCLLYPASTKSEPRLESMVLLATYTDARKLTDRVINRHLAYLAAYMAKTSLDGSMTALQRWRCLWIYLFCRRALDGRMQSRRIVIVIGEILKWSAMVGTSGLLLLLVQSWMKVGP